MSRHPMSMRISLELSQTRGIGPDFNHDFSVRTDKPSAVRFQSIFFCTPREKFVESFDVRANAFGRRFENTNGTFLPMDDVCHKSVTNRLTQEE